MFVGAAQGCDVDALFLADFVAWKVYSGTMNNFTSPDFAHELSSEEAMDVAL